MTGLDDTEEADEGVGGGRLSSAILGNGERLDFGVEETEEEEGNCLIGDENDEDGDGSEDLTDGSGAGSAGLLERGMEFEKKRLEDDRKQEREKFNKGEYDKGREIINETEEFDLVE